MAPASPTADARHCPGGRSGTASTHAASRPGASTFDGTRVRRASTRRNHSQRPYDRQDHGPSPDARRPRPAADPAPKPPRTPIPAPAPEPAPAPAPRHATPTPTRHPTPRRPAPAARFSSTATSTPASRAGTCSRSAPGPRSSPAAPSRAPRRPASKSAHGDVEPDTGSQRSEVSGPTFKEGEDLYIRDAIRVPAANTYSAPWQIIQQLHEEDWSGSPGMAVFLENNRALKLGAGDGSPTFWQGPTLQTDRWYDLVYRVNLSQSSSAGFVEVWLDGVQQSSSTDRRGSTDRPPRCPKLTSRPASTAPRRAPAPASSNTTRSWSAPATPP